MGGAFVEEEEGVEGRASLEEIIDLLGKSGKPNANTPQDWVVYYNSEKDNNLVK